MPRETTLVVEASTAAPTGFETSYSWYGHTDPDGGHSLLKLLEENGEGLRSTYLRWVSDAGRSLYRGRSLTEWTALTETFSYWWMTLIAERSVWKTPAIIDALRVLVLEDVIADDPPDRLVLVSSEPRLRSSVQQLCEAHGVTFVWKKTLRDRALGRNEPGRHARLHPLAAALATFAKYIYRWWKLRSATPMDFTGDGTAVMIVTRTRHPTSPVDSTQIPHSNHWPNLPTLLDKEGIGSNWLEVPSEVGHAPRLSNWYRRLQRNGEQTGEDEVHVVLDSFLSGRVLLRVATNYIRLVMVYLRLRPSRIRASLANRPWLWHLHNDAWKRSLLGSPAVENLVWLALFDKALGNAPPQRRGFYLSEGQSWEVALVNAWQRNGLGELVAVPHSTVRFWDLRYFPDIMVSSGGDTYSRPDPDLVAVNGSLSREVLNGPGIPRKSTVECEALRYMHLSSAPRWTPPSQSPDRATSVLLVADYLTEINEAMMRVVEETLPLMQPEPRFAIKPQPHGTMPRALVEQVRAEIRTEAISELVHDFDVALVSSGTSAVVDLYMLGIPLIVYQYEDNLDFCPLRGMADLPTVETAGELAQALEESVDWVDPPAPADNLFFLDPALHKWMALVNPTQDP